MLEYKKGGRSGELTACSHTETVSPGLGKLTASPVTPECISH